MQSPWHDWSVTDPGRDISVLSASEKVRFCTSDTEQLSSIFITTVFTRSVWKGGEILSIS